MTDVVLVHGTTQAPSGWDPVVGRLRADGHRAFAVDLQSERDDEPVEALAERARRQLPQDLASPVVAAHSGSGLVLPALAAVLDARRQVWVAAAVPDAAGGRSFAAEVGAGVDRVVSPEWVGVDPTTDPVLATYFLFHDTDLATLRWALGTVRPFTSIAAAYAQEPVADPAAVPSTYLLPRRDRTLRPDWMARACRHRLAIEPVVLDTGHCPHVSAPDLVAHHLTGAAR